MTRLLNLLVTVLLILPAMSLAAQTLEIKLWTVETDDLWLALRGWPPSPACDDYAARLSTLTNQKRGCPTSRAFREVGYRAADTGASPHATPPAAVSPKNATRRNRHRSPAPHRTNPFGECREPGRSVIIAAVFAVNKTSSI